MLKYRENKYKCIISLLEELFFISNTNEAQTKTVLRERRKMDFQVELFGHNELHKGF